MKLAENLGVDLGLVVDDKFEGVYFRKVKDFLENEKIDVVMDCVGGQKSLNLSLELVKKGGIIEFLGIPTDRCWIDLLDI